MFSAASGFHLSRSNRGSNLSFQFRMTIGRTMNMLGSRSTIIRFFWARLLCSHTRRPAIGWSLLVMTDASKHVCVPFGGISKRGHFAFTTLALPAARLNLVLAAIHGRNRPDIQTEFRKTF